MDGKLAMKGMLGARLMREKAPLSWKIRNTIRPVFWLGWLFNKAARLFSRVTGIPTMIGELRATLRRGSDGMVIDYGLVSCRMITTAFCTFVCAQLGTETSVFGDFKYHDSGVGTTDPAIGDTDIETTDGESRVAGTQVPSGVTYASVGTIAYTTSKAITEHGLFNASTSVTLMDRSEFAAINVVNGDSIQFTYTLTLTAGG